MKPGILLAGVLLWAGAASAQFGRGGAEWVTGGSDTQRSHSLPTDPKISPEGMQKPGFEFLWKRKLDNQPVQMDSLMPAILMDRYIGYRGFRSFAFIAGSSNTIWGIDSDLNRVEWTIKLPVAASAGSLDCPGGLTSPVARATYAGYPAPGTFGGLGGRGGAARSDVGMSGEGAVTIAAALKAASNPGPPRPQGGRRQPAVIYVVSSDGALHAMYISNGVEPEPPVPFVPANARAEGLVVMDDVAYTTTHACNGAAAGVWAYDIESKKVSSWKSSSGDIAGSAGPAFGPDGTIYAATASGELVALDPKALVVKAHFSSSAGFTSSPVVFRAKEKDYVAVATKDGRIHVLDASLSGQDRVSAPYSANFVPGALSTWQASNGTRWILAAAGAPAAESGFTGQATNGAVAAWKIADRNGTMAIEPGWISRDLVSPLPPMIINGVVFALSSGEYRPDDKAMTATQRAQKSTPAVLYALDGATGKTLWDSGKTITSFVHSGGLSGGASQIYLATYDGTFYAFGFPIEH